MSFIGNAPADKLLTSADIADGSITPAKLTNMAGDGAIFLNAQTITANTSIPSGQNGHSVGPMSVATGVTVTVASGSRWVIN